MDVSMPSHQEQRTKNETESPDSAIHSAQTSQASPEERTAPLHVPPIIPTSTLLTNTIRDLPIRHSSMTPHILGPEYTKFLVEEDPLMIVLPRRTRAQPPSTGTANCVICEQDSSCLVKEIETIKAPRGGAPGHKSSHLTYSSLARQSSLTRSGEMLLEKRSLGKDVEEGGSLTLRGLNLELLRRYIYDVPTRSYKIRYVREVKLATELVAPLDAGNVPNTTSAPTTIQRRDAQPQRIRVRHPPASSVRGTNYAMPHQPILRGGTFERHSASRQPLRPSQGGAAKQLLTVRSRSQEAPKRVEIATVDQKRNLIFSSSTDVLRRLIQPMDLEGGYKNPPSSSVTMNSMIGGLFTPPADYRIVAQHMRSLERNGTFTTHWQSPNLVPQGYDTVATPHDDWKSPLIPHRLDRPHRSRKSPRKVKRPKTAAKPVSNPMALNGLKPYCLYIFIPLLIVLAAATAIVAIIRYI